MKRLMLLILILRTTFAAISQTPSDTICIPVKKAINAVRQNELAKLYLEELSATKTSYALAKQDIRDKQDRINAKDSTIEAMRMQYSASLNNILATEGEVRSLNQKYSISLESINKLQKTVKSEKAKRSGLTILLGAVIAGSAYLIIFK